MTRSMTGYGSAEGTVDGVHFTVELRSVNNRYFKTLIKLPEGFGGVESDIDGLLRRRLSRGSVTAMVRMRLVGGRELANVNAEVLRAYLEQLRELEVDANPTLRIDLGAMLALPGVCEPPAVEELVEHSRAGLMDLVKQALDAILDMRQREGEALEADLLAQCDALAAALAAIAGRAPAVPAEYHRKLKERVEELVSTAKVNIDEDTLAREVAIYAERCDIAEEISRLTGHIEQFRETLAADGGSGRKLDFIAQEMLREANTIGSKSNDAEITRRVVEAKTAIDRIKEQVQNVE